MRFYLYDYWYVLQNTAGLCAIPIGVGTVGARCHEYCLDGPVLGLLGRVDYATCAIIGS